MGDGLIEDFQGLLDQELREVHRQHPHRIGELEELAALKKVHLARLQTMANDLSTLVDHIPELRLPFEIYNSKKAIELTSLPIQVDGESVHFQYRLWVKVEPDKVRLSDLLYTLGYGSSAYESSILARAGLGDCVLAEKYKDDESIRSSLRSFRASCFEAVGELQDEGRLARIMFDFYKDDFFPVEKLLLNRVNSA